MNLRKLFTLFLLILIVTACKKGQENRIQLGTFYLSEMDKQNFPFNHSITPKYTADNEFITFEDLFTDNNFLESCPYNCNEYYKFETSLKAFTSEHYTLEYILWAKSKPEDLHSHLSILWFENKPDPNDITVFRSGFYLPFDSNDFSGTMQLFDSIMVNDFWYQNVISDTILNQAYPQFPDSVLRPTRYYYSSNNGIIKYEMSDGNSWRLIQE